VTEIQAALDAALSGGPQRHHEKTAEQGKLPVRERVERLVDPGTFAEEALLANWQEEGLGADGVLTGLAFQATVTAFTVTRENEMSLSTLFRFGIIPLFLFSGTFFPISQLPDQLQLVAYFTPLFHGVELVRKVALPGADTSIVTSLPAWVSVVYLVAMAAAGIVLGSRWLDRRLKP